MTSTAEESSEQRTTSFSELAINETLTLFSRAAFTVRRFFSGFSNDWCARPMHFSRAFDVDRSNCRHCSRTAPLIARPTTLFFRGYTNAALPRERGRKREDAEERKREGKKERWLSFFPLRLRGSILIIFRPLCIPSMAGAGQGSANLRH